jgi:hypothetical protein
MLISFTNSGSFDPEMTSLMGIAYERACKAVTNFEMREAVAKRIIEAVRRGERHIELLVQTGVQGFGARPS